jgi:hypothetical protein
VTGTIRGVFALFQKWLRGRRAAKIDAAYAAYDEHPLDEPDAWGDLVSFLEAASRFRWRSDAS